VGFDPARSLFVDDSRAVLHAAIAAGIAQVFGCAARTVPASRTPTKSFKRSMR
jgi:beta-phosphoglucomutase-like phosphatase (HAD superfamily)